MPAPDASSPSPRAESVDPAARREQLALLCALDRANLRLLFVPRTSRPAEGDAGFDGDLLHTLLRATRFLPGRIGRWSRRAGLLEFALRLFR